MEVFNSSPSSSSSSAFFSLSPAINRCNPMITRVPNTQTKNSSPNHHKDKQVFLEPISNNSMDDEKTIKRVDETISKAKTSKFGWRKSLRCITPGRLTSSMRYLLDDKSLANITSDSGVPDEIFSDEKADDGHHQVVVLRVSLHCKGCEKQVRKYISKMDGVTSFDIDFTTKKVIVTASNNITPEEVVSRISKVKNAQLWQ